MSAAAFLMAAIAATSMHAGAVPAADTVVGVSDGDTLTVLTKQRERVRVRLAEIDAPEKAQAFGERSKQSLSSLCFGKRAALQGRERDRYGRLVARVQCDGVDAQAHQVRNGMAWVYRQYSSDRQLLGFERQAQQERRGLWQDPHAVAPWNFRRTGLGQR